MKRCGQSFCLQFITGRNGTLFTCAVLVGRIGHPKKPVGHRKLLVRIVFICFCMFQSSFIQGLDKEKLPQNTGYQETSDAKKYN